MKRTSPGAFTVFNTTQEPPINVNVAPSEPLIGWYQNPPPWEDCVIVFTPEAFYIVNDGRVDRIAIKDIIGYESPKSKTDVTGVRILTKDGFHFVRVAGYFGPNGNQKDAYSFIMVVRALIPDAPVIKFPADPSDSHT
jgi:hypothetical protein